MPFVAPTPVPNYLSDRSTYGTYRTTGYAGGTTRRGATNYRKPYARGTMSTAPRTTAARVKRNNTDTTFNRTGAKTSKKRRATTMAQEVQDLKSKVRYLSKEQHQDLSTLTYRNIRSSTAVAGRGECYWENTNFSSREQLETSLTQVTIVNPSTPATPETVDFTTGTYARSLTCEGAYHKATFTCRFEQPVEVWAYVLSPKVDTDVAPKTDFLAGLNELPSQKVVGATAFTATTIPTIMYPSDSQKLMEMWKIVKSSKFVLQPGDSVQMTHATKGFTFDFEGEASKYQPSLDSSVLFYRVAGIHGYGSTSGFNRAKARVDVVVETTHKWRYIAGLSINDVQTSNQLTATVGDVKCNSKPDTAVVDDSLVA